MKIKKIKFCDISSAIELKSRVNADNILSVGCHWSKIKKFVSEKPFPGSHKIRVIYSPGYGGTAEIIRYI